LLIVVGLRDGALAQLDRVLGWSGGERAGAFVSWSTQDTPTATEIARLYNADYHLLRRQFPDISLGWLNSRSFGEEVELEASASMGMLRPPALAAGRWFTVEEEDQKAAVAVLGPELARDLAHERNLEMNELIGQTWRVYTIVGVMKDWPALHSMGYYPDAAYIPVGFSFEHGRAWSLNGQVAFVIPAKYDFTAVVEEMRAVLRSSHPEGEPQVILPAEELGDLLSWRTRLYEVLGLFASLCLVIAGIGVMNAVFIWVVGRWREIGIRRAVGATRGEIVRLVLAQAARLTLSGAAVGGVIGTLVALIVQRSQGWPLTVYPYWLAVAAGIALLAALLFGSIPALWAATCSPTEMLRTE
jgi:putative ABC transport system permease protein